jgi:hypothetical protein
MDENINNISLIKAHLKDLENSSEPITTFVIGNMNTGVTITTKNAMLCLSKKLFADSYFESDAKRIYDENSDIHHMKIYDYVDWYVKRLDFLELKELTDELLAILKNYMNANHPATTYIIGNIETDTTHSMANGTPERVKDFYPDSFVSEFAVKLCNANVKEIDKSTIWQYSSIMIGS